MRIPSAVLLVEDNPDDVLLIRRAHSKAGLTSPLHVVTNGDMAVDYLSGTGQYSDRAHHPMPAVVLLDLKLPRRSGLEVLAWMRSVPELKHLPVVVLTSSRQDADIREAYDRGANSYLVKPVSFDALLAMVRAVEHYWATLNERVSGSGSGAWQPA